MRDACAATAFVAVLVLSSSVALVQDQAHRAEAGAPAGSALLWRVPEDIGSRNLYYGAGGVENRPRGTGIRLSKETSKGDLQSYSRSEFITNVTPDEVDFAVPSRPPLVYLFAPWRYISRLGLCWIGRHIPRDHARWVGQILARLSADQVRDAFRAAQYSPEEVEGFARAVEERIARLNRL